jgi:DNA (cytosine-5)-methyltransferase 1
MTLEVLNLYAGIGGNRKLWDDVTNVDVTAVEWDTDKAKVYRDYFPQDTVIEADAHEYLLEHFNKYDFIWASPPCPTHSQLESMNHSQYKPRYPDMDLYAQILILKKHHKRLEYDYCVENVVSYYEPLVEPEKVSRHYFWSNFVIGNHDTPTLKKRGVEGREHRSDHGSGFNYDAHESELGYDLSTYDISKSKKGKMLRNCVHPKLGKHILKAATINRQATLFE